MFFSSEIFTGWLPALCTDIATQDGFQNGVWLSIMAQMAWRSLLLAQLWMILLTNQYHVCLYISPSHYTDSPGFVLFYIFMKLWFEMNEFLLLRRPFLFNKEFCIRKGMSGLLLLHFSKPPLTFPATPLIKIQPQSGVCSTRVRLPRSDDRLHCTRTVLKHKHLLLSLSTSPPEDEKSPNSFLFVYPMKLPSSIQA